MEPIKTKGIVIRQVNYGDYDKMLTVLTYEYGKISVSAKGVRGMKNKNRAACELLCYDEFVLSRPRGEVYGLNQCSCIESFYKLRTDITRLALGIYMADLAGQLSLEDMGAALKLLLNSLYMLGDGENDIFLMKLIYDLKLLKVAGLTPETEECVNCQSTNGPFSFSALSGGVLCRKCAYEAGLKPVNERVLKLTDYILKKNLSVSLYKIKADKETVNAALDMAEAFIAVHIKEEIKTLEYFRKLVKMQ